jgi:hypothetical protein
MAAKAESRLTTYRAERQVSDELPAIQTDLFWMPQRPLMAGCRSSGRRGQWPDLAGNPPFRQETGFLLVKGRFCLVRPVGERQLPFLANDGSGHDVVRGEWQLPGSENSRAAFWRRS